MNNYLLCTVARSGKSWIAETLYWLGLGYGLELLTEFERGAAPDQELMRAASERDGLAGIARVYMENDRRKGYPCSGVTLQWTNLTLIDEARQVAELSALIEALQPCELFFLRREDTLAQAISHFIMMKSGYSHSTSPEHLRAGRANIAYDGAEIANYLDFTERSFAGWDAMFARLGQSPQVLIYEDFVRDPIERFGALARRISGRTFSTDAIANAADCQRRLSDTLDQELREKYLANSRV